MIELISGNAEMSNAGESGSNSEVTDRFGKDDRHCREERRHEQAGHDFKCCKSITAVYSHGLLKLLAEPTHRISNYEIGEGNSLDHQDHRYANGSV